MSSRIDEIKYRVIQKSGKSGSPSSGDLRIPGMNIGTRIAPGAPTYEDIIWLMEKLDQAVRIIKGLKDDGAKKLIEEIEAEYAH